jgi:lipopolysaccharide/colanic/teichoic acid biosynthesis glycosyltransferase
MQTSSYLENWKSGFAHLKWSISFPLWLSGFLNRIAALAILIVCLPFIVFFGIRIKFDSPGPAIFKQIRMGIDCSPFVFYKFRTMKHDANKLYPELYAYHYSEEKIKKLFFKKENDPRLTTYGRWLRKTSFDELPNFINVLKGDMNLVGPRPEIPEMLPYYSPEQQLKFSVKPGITGLAQINGRGHLSFQDTIKEDLAYVDNCSIILDLKILIRTAIATMITRNGAF